jgi:hypothetical protein
VLLQQVVLHLMHAVAFRHDMLAGLCLMEAGALLEYAAAGH